MRMNQEDPVKEGEPEEGASSDVLICRMTVPMGEDYPTWHGHVARNHPDLHFVTMSRMILDGNLVMEDNTVKGLFDREALANEIRRGPNVRSVEILERSENSAVFRVILKSTPFTTIFRELEIMLRFPTVFDQGVVHVTVVASRTDIGRLFARLRKLSPDARMVSIRHERALSPKSVLTDRQRKIFQRALSAGYWDVPRRTSLQELSEVLQISKSALSESLATIENRLLHEVSQEPA